MHFIPMGKPGSKSFALSYENSVSVASLASNRKNSLTSDCCRRNSSTTHMFGRAHSFSVMPKYHDGTSNSESFLHVVARLNEVAQDLFSIHMNFSAISSRKSRSASFDQCHIEKDGSGGVEVDEEELLRTAYQLYRV